MPVFTVESQNDKFSLVMQKHPDTQKSSGEPFYKKSGRQHCYAWYDSANKMTLVSLLKNKDEAGYLEYDHICGGEYYLDLIKTHTNHIIGKLAQDIDTEECKVTFSIYKMMNYKVEKIFDESIKVTEDVKDKIAKITIQASSIKLAIEAMSVLCILYSSGNENDRFFTVEQIEKYLKCAKYVGIKYTAFRALLNRIIPDRNIFKKIQGSLEECDFKFNPGNALSSRIDFYKKFADAKTVSHLLEIGCGEGTYFKHHKYDNVDAIDIDAQEVEKAINKMKRYRKENITTHVEDAIEYTSKLETLKDSDVLITEVLEHMPQEKSLELMTNVIQKQPKSICITVPNSSFNKFYELNEGEFRHDDHDWEPTFTDMKQFIESIPGISGYNIDYSPIGDQLRNDPTVSSSIGIVLKRI
jgi:SAM-dependent methyltransferase